MRFNYLGAFSYGYLSGVNLIAFYAGMLALQQGVDGVAKISWNPKGTAKGQPLSPITWGCYIYMREDGSFETEFKGQTGFMMMKGAMDVLHIIDRLRSEPAYDWGRFAIEDFDPPTRI